MISCLYRSRLTSKAVLMVAGICSGLLGVGSAWADEMLMVDATQIHASHPDVLIEPELPPPLDQTSVQGFSNEKISNRATDLLPPSTFAIGQPLTILATDPQFSQTEVQGSNAEATAGSTGGRLDIPLGGRSDSAFQFGFGSRIPDVSALNGVTRERTVLSGSHQSSVIYITNYLKYQLSDRQTILLETAIDPHLFGFDLGFTTTTTNPKQGIAFNIFLQQSWVPVFKGGEQEVYLPIADQVP